MNNKKRLKEHSVSISIEKVACKTLLQLLPVFISFHQLIDQRNSPYYLVGTIINDIMFARTTLFFLILNLTGVMLFKLKKDETKELHVRNNGMSVCLFSVTLRRVS